MPPKFPFNLVVILGPTATGKTKLAAQLASTFNGEIISADSRQVYRRMDIGTGKDYDDYAVNGRQIPYHLIDIIEPSEEYNLFLFKEDFKYVFNEITKKEFLPILAGGTGMYLDAVIRDYKLEKADFGSDEIVKLQSMDIDQLKGLLFSLSPELHNTTDLLDKERIIKAIAVNRKVKISDSKTDIEIKPFVLGVNLPRDEVKKRITERLKLRLKNGMLEEVEGLVKSGITYEKLNFFGLEYKFIGQYLAGSLTYNDMFQKLNSAIHQFAKRQMTWFRKMEREGVNIHWLNGPDYDQAYNLMISNGFSISLQERNGI